MIDLTSIQESLALPIPKKSQELARQFASICDDPIAARRIYLNTLAVLAVNDYLHLIGIDTDLRGSEICNPILRLGADIADLKVRGCGRLECRAVLPGESLCSVPPEAIDDRLGYVVVEIDEAHKQAALLGFSRTANNFELQVARLQPLEKVIERLYESKKSVVLSQWFDRVFESGWQTLESLFATDTLELTPSLRSLRKSNVPDLPAAASGAKLIDLGVDLGKRTVALLVKIVPNSDGQVGVHIQVHPAPGDAYLHPNLELSLFSDRGERLRDVRSRSLDNYIQLPFFQGYPGERFQIQLALDRASLVEDFTI
ncbi:MAG: DUF1822 family protein [Cyanobacteriota bacterium]|nr:DUF1822 family protein [Cyanobacteriota bacterium]